MLKKRFNLRILAAIVACLAVTAVFASCDKDGNDDDETTSGNIEKKIIGRWQTTGYDPYNVKYTYTYFFLENGRFEYFRNYGSASGGAEGKYRTSNGNVYFSELNGINAIGERTPYDDIVFEYEFLKDDVGEYLFICHCNYLGEDRYLSDCGRKFRKIK